MDAHPVTHLTDQTLSSYGLGKLDDASAEAVNQHLEQCADCRKRVAEMSADSFLGRIRDAQKAASHAMSEPSQPDKTQSYEGSSGQAAPRTTMLPPGLAEHPDYEIRRELGRGGMGVVYLAHNRLMARDEVLKVMGPQIVEEPGVLDRFLREIRAVARLRHPNIVSAYTAFRCGKSLVFAMEYVAGLDLARMVKAKGPMPVGNACNYVHQAALGLQHAHEEGMVHRDIKPGNLMLSYNGNRAVIKVLDFGLAKASREQYVSDRHQDESMHHADWVGSLTRTGQMLGTPDFIAPEQIVDAQRADIRADIYSLGCTLYCLLSGRAPFQATPQDVLRAHRSMDARPLNVVRPEVPGELAAVVAKMMAKEPDLRFQEPDEVALALSPYFKKRFAGLARQELGASKDGLAEVAADVQPVRRDSRWYRRAVAVASAIGFAAILLAAVVAYRTVTDKGELVIETEDPGIELVVRQGGRLVTVIDPRIEKHVELRSGRYELAIAGDKLGLRLSTESFTLERGEKRLVSVRRKTLPPPSSVATPKSDQRPPLVQAGSKTEHVSATKNAEKAVAPPRDATPPAVVVDAGKVQAPTPAQRPTTLVEEKRGQIGAPWHRLSPFDEQVDRAIRGAVKFLREQQRADGSWPESDDRFKTGTTSQATLALLSAGERPDSPTVRAALDYLRGFGSNDLKSTYEIALQTMVFAAAEPDVDQLRIASNVTWLGRAQIKPADPVKWPGSWTYSDSKRTRPGDNSNTQYALLGLHAASEVGVPVWPIVWELAHDYWERSQMRDGGWADTPDSTNETAAMTCAGVSSLIITGLRRFQGHESLQGETIQNCGKGGINIRLQAGINWLAEHFQVSPSVGHGEQYKLHYLYGLERAGRMAGLRFFGRNDWYRLGAEELVRTQNKLSGFWTGGGENEIVGTSVALLFLARGRAPVLVHELSRRPSRDWNKDADDVRNLVGVVSREWRHLLTWQVIDPDAATTQDMLRAPVAFFNGHAAPVFSARAKQNLRRFVEQGGFIFAEACCGFREFDQGFKELMTEIFPEPEYKLRPLSEDHPVWRSKHLLSPDIHPLWGIEHGCRTVVIYSPQDLSCFWNQFATLPANTGVIKSIKVGQNVIDYATGREMPADKLTVGELHYFKADAFKKGELKVAKLKHAGEWNIAPQAIPNLMDTLRKPPYNFEVEITQKDLYPRDPNLVHYRLIYIHGRAALSLSPEDADALRKHLERGGGMIFADAACGSVAFDAAFRRFVAELLPKNPMVLIHHNDPIFATKIGFDLHDVKYTKGAGGARDFPQLEGVKINGHWSIIYSKYDIGCALARHSGLECKGYSYESAIKIAANIMIYSTLP